MDGPKCNINEERVGGTGSDHQLLWRHVACCVRFKLASSGKFESFVVSCSSLTLILDNIDFPLNCFSDNNPKIR